MGVEKFCLNCTTKGKTTGNFCSNRCKTEFKSKRTYTGNLEGLHPVKIDKKTTIFIKNPEDAERIRKKYIRHIGNSTDEL